MNLTFDKPLRQTLSGMVWLSIGLAAIVLSGAIKKPGFANNQDPGPQFFPILLGSLMVAGGVALCGSSLFAKWKSGTHPSDIKQVKNDKDQSAFGVLIGFWRLYFYDSLVGFYLIFPWIRICLGLAAGESLVCVRFHDPCLDDRD